MDHSFLNTTQLWSHLLIDQLVKLGVKRFYACPGLRNAPLLRAINIHPQAEIFTGFDERAQSYRALGAVKASGEACALLCTSGTAVANFLPAIIEAQKTYLPLVVLSADRPDELVSVDANQTIDQSRILRTYTKNFWHMSEPDPSYNLNAVLGKLSHLIHQSTTAPKGPLHINIPLREPLDLKKESIDDHLLSMATKFLNQSGPKLSILNNDETMSEKAYETLETALHQAKKPLIIFGPLERANPDYLNVIQNFLNFYKGSFYCDVETGAKFVLGAVNGLIPTLDHPEVLKEVTDYKPDLIIHFGHRLTSKHYYSFLEKHPDLSVMQVVHTTYHQDPGFSFASKIHADPVKILQTLGDRLKRTIGEKISCDWSGLIEGKEKIIEDSELSYPFISKRAIEHLSNADSFFIGNSTFIRSFDSYASYKGKNNALKVFANRGVSGIEGHMATAQGIQETTQSPSVLFLGDVSFIHDLGSLMTFKQDHKILVVVANNHGGGIFHLLPIAKEKETLPLLTTPHKYDLSTMIKSVGHHCIKVTNKEELIATYEDWNNNPRLLFLEVEITDSGNQKVYDKLRTVKL